eukprot:TRINITY_DN15069_c0_g1_i1.p1 TRINITY_DN15069_c0_g1~~TRINITY_DN15069_c0_g1_i1.p1  ORF type:complete len:1860 (-),score=488.09 TRINITY_DN15069_c0_g1_i1:1015-6594(-)
MAPRPEKAMAISLTEIGKKLVGVKSTPKDALIKLLKSAATQLPEVAQSAGPSTTSTIKPCVEAIVEPQYLNHKDKDVRLLVAFCCSEAMRVFAPDPPYSDPALKEIFHLFVSIFQRLNEVDSPLYPRMVGILETLAKVKTCIVMLDLELDDLILEMFQIFFRVASAQHSRDVMGFMADVMSTLLDESEDLQRPLLEGVLVHLLERTQKESSAAYQLAVRVVQKSADHLQPCVQRYLMGIIATQQGQLIPDAESAEGEELRNNYHELIFELYQAAPQMLVAVLPTMQEELLNKDIDARLKAVDLLGKIFSLPGQRADQEYRQLHGEFMKRYVDQAVEVRMKMVEWSEKDLITGSSSNVSDHFEALETRLLDYDDKVRMQVVRVVCHVARVRPQSVPMSLLKEVGARLRDKKIPVRRLTLPEITHVYRQFCERDSEGKGGAVPDLEWIPSKIIRCSWDKEVKEFKTQAIDTFLDDELFPAKLSIKERARHWVNIYAAMEETDMKVLNVIFRGRSQVQSEMSKYMQIRKKIKEDKESGDSGEDIGEQLRAKEAIAKCFRLIAQYGFVDAAKAEEHLWKLHALKDNNIFKLLQQLMDPKTTLVQARTQREELLKRLGEKHPLHDWMRELASKLGFTLFGEEHVSEIVELLQGGQLEGQEDLLSAAIRLLGEVSTYFPVLFEGGLLADLARMLVEGSEPVREGVAKLFANLANAGESMREVLRQTYGNVQEPLQKMALEGTRKQAKHAVAAISAVGENGGLKDLSLLYQLLLESMHKNEHLPSVFQALGTVAQYSLPVWETKEDEIIKFVVRNVLRRQSEHSRIPDKKPRKFDWNAPSKECLQKVYGIKMLVKSFLQIRDTALRPARLKGLLSVLLKIIPLGEISDEMAKASTDVDRAHIRLAAAKATLRLARRYDSYMQSTCPTLFHFAVFAAHDACLQVRQQTVQKVHQYLQVRGDFPLPSKYAATFALSALDVEKTNIAAAKRFLAEFVESSRRELAMRQASSAAATASSSGVGGTENGVGTSASAGGGGSSSLTSHPEYVLVYLVHLLAHHPDIPRGDNAQDDLKGYEPFKLQLELFLRALLMLDSEGKGEKRDEVDSLPAILAIFRNIKNVTEDAIDATKTELLYTICDLGLLVAKELGRKRLYSGEFPGRIPLPSALYKPPVEGEAIVEKVDGSHLPRCFLGSEEDGLGGKGGGKAKSSSVVVAKAAPAARGRKRAKTENTADDDEEGSPPAADEGEAPPVPPEHETKRLRPTRGAPEALPLAELPAPSPPPSSKKSTTKAVAAVTPAADEKKKNDGPQLLSTGKRIRGAEAALAKAEAGQSPALAKRQQHEADMEAMVGRRIRVWWPMDKAYYTGKITKYSSEKKLHHVAYDDGDTETLSLTKEKWEALDAKGQPSMHALPSATRVGSPQLPGSVKRSHKRAEPKPSPLAVAPTASPSITAPTERKTRAAAAARSPLEASPALRSVETSAPRSAPPQGKGTTDGGSVPVPDAAAPSGGRGRTRATSEGVGAGSENGTTPASTSKPKGKTAASVGTEGVPKRPVGRPKRVSAVTAVPSPSPEVPPADNVTANEGVDDVTQGAVGQVGRVSSVTTRSKSEGGATAATPTVPVTASVSPSPPPPAATAVTEAAGSATAMDWSEQDVPSDEQIEGQVSEDPNGSPLAPGVATRGSAKQAQWDAAAAATAEAGAGGAKTGGATGPSTGSGRNVAAAAAPASEPVTNGRVSKEEATAAAGGGAKAKEPPVALVTKRGTRSQEAAAQLLLQESGTSAAGESKGGSTPGAGGRKDESGAKSSTGNGKEGSSATAMTAGGKKAALAAEKGGAVKANGSAGETGEAGDAGDNEDEAQEGIRSRRRRR